MQGTSSLNLSHLSREEKFEIWKRRSGWTSNNLAAAIGISKTRFSSLIRGTTMPEEHYYALLKMGVPDDCLPIAEDKKPGPKAHPAPYLGEISSF